MPGLARRGLTKVRPVGGLDSVVVVYSSWEIHDYGSRRSIAKVRRIGAWVAVAQAD